MHKFDKKFIYPDSRRRLKRDATGFNWILSQIIPAVKKERKKIKKKSLYY